MTRCYYCPVCGEFYIGECKCQLPKPVESSSVGVGNGATFLNPKTQNPMKYESDFDREFERTILNVVRFSLIGLTLFGFAIGALSYWMI